MMISASAVSPSGRRLIVSPCACGVTVFQSKRAGRAAVACRNVSGRFPDPQTSERKVSERTVSKRKSVSVAR